MTDVTITDAAVEAAIAALVARVFGGLAAPSPQALTLIREDLTAELAAAAPYIAAQVASDIHGQFGVNVSDEMSDWWDGYRQAQRDVLRKLREIEAYYQIEADHHG